MKTKKLPHHRDKFWGRHMGPPVPTQGPRRSSAQTLPRLLPKLLPPGPPPAPLWSLPPAEPQPFPCPHDGCLYGYVTYQKLENHLAVQHVCQPSCSGCAQAIEILQKKRKREEDQQEREVLLTEQHAALDSALRRKLEQMKKRARRMRNPLDLNTTRRKQAKVALCTLYNTDDYTDSVAQLLQGDKKTLAALCKQIPELQAPHHDRPSTYELLAFKDDMLIPTKEWYRAQEAFQLDEQGSVHRLRLLQDELNQTLPITPSGEFGYNLPMLM